MSLLEYLPSVRPAAYHLDEFEDALVAWAHDPAKPDVVDLGRYGQVPMVELSHRLEESQATLTASACAQIGLPTGSTIATAAAALLHATVDPAGPRCRSFRAASYYLRGLSRLDLDLPALPAFLGSNTEGSTGHPDGR